MLNPGDEQLALLDELKVFQLLAIEPAAVLEQDEQVVECIELIENVPLGVVGGCLRVSDELEAILDASRGEEGLVYTKVKFTFLVIHLVGKVVPD
jgi:hypothetical protein